DVRATPILPCLLAAFDPETKLCRDDDAIANRRERLADELFIGKGTVDFGGVEKRDAAIDGVADELNSRLRVDRLAQSEAEPHAAEPDCRYFQFVPAARFGLRGVPESEPI